MILLKELRRPEMLVHLQDLDGERQTHKVPLAPIIDAATALGLHEMLLEHPEGAAEHFHLSPRSAPAAVAEHSSPGAPVPAAAPSGLDAVLLEHFGTVEAGRLVYDARFRHERAALPFLTAYASLLLAGAGFRERHILQFRLALYELCANAVEHGVVLQTPPEIGIHLALTPGEVSGWIQDGCEHFDPTMQPAGSIKQRAEARATRGYGIHMMHQLLEQFRHEFNTTGNRIHFRKRFGQ
jgi:anti-sigma regulatory factor (Ser/Thr protein kinase)